MTDKPFKPSRAFLRKVAEGNVCATFRYSRWTRGGRHDFIGGKAIYEAHLRHGYVNPAPTADLGRPGYVTLTAAGRAALAEKKR